MPLTDTAIRKFKPADRQIKLTDGRGLYLLVTTSGAKYWRLKYRYQGREKVLALGVYPDVSLAKARDRRDEARRQLADGIDPSQHRKAVKAAQTLAAAGSFEIVAREWIEKNAPRWAPTHTQRLIRRFERDIFPWLGNRPIGEIVPQELLEVLRRIEARGALETARPPAGAISAPFQASGQLRFTTA